jgi:hypothetical protein
MKTTTMIALIQSPPAPLAFKVMLYSLAAAGLFGVAHAQSEESVTQPYTVIPGDSLQNIAQRLFKFGGTWQQLRDLNGIAPDSENRIYPGQTLKINRVWVQAPPPPPLLSTQARVISAGAGSNVLAAAALTEGARVRTGALAGATIELEDKSQAQLAPNTDLELVQLKKDNKTGQLRSVFRLITGSLQIVVPKLVGASPDRLLVRTSTATVGIRGTTFRVSASGEQGPTISEVLEGRAELDAAGSQVALPGGFGSKALANAPPLAAVALLPASVDFTRLPPYETDAKTITTTARFDWVNVPGAALYQVTLAHDSQFENILSSTSTTASSVNFASVPRGYLFIKVRAYDSNGIGGYDLTKALRM